jgi:release factor glutamine methyltransferase
MNIADAIKHTRAELESADVPNASMDAGILVSHVVDRDKAYLIAHPESELTEHQLELLMILTARRAAREPLQYIVGYQEFFGREFKVTPGVLIPRPETEILVERAILFLRQVDAPRFCEIGVGSGCISVSILSEVANGSAVGVDISETAIRVADENAQLMDVRDRIEFIVSDLFSSVAADGFDAIVSNPPYVPEPDLGSLQPEVRDFEPHVALTSGTAGLDLIERLIAEAPARLKPDGALIFEIGFDQSERVREMFDDRLWRDIEFLADLQGFPRVAFGIKR